MNLSKALSAAFGVCEPLATESPSWFHVCFRLEQEFQGPSTNRVFIIHVRGLVCLCLAFGPVFPSQTPSL